MSSWATALSIPVTSRARLRLRALYKRRRNFSCSFSSFPYVGVKSHEGHDPFIPSFKTIQPARDAEEAVQVSASSGPFRSNLGSDNSRSGQLLNLLWSLELYYVAAFKVWVGASEWGHTFALCMSSLCSALPPAASPPFSFLPDLSLSCQNLLLSW